MLGDVWATLGTFRYIIIFALIWILVYALYVWLTPFTKTLRVTNKDIYAYGEGRSLVARNSIADEQGNVYRIANAWPLLEFKSAEALMSIQLQETYEVRGYGIRVPILGLFPTIYKVKKVKA